MAPDLGIEGDDGMWGQADERSEQGKKQPQHEERAASWLLSRIGITSPQPRTVAGLLCRCLGTRHGPGAARGHLPSQLQHRTQARPDQPDWPDQATLRKGRQEESPHTAWPPYLKPHSHPHSGNNTDGQLRHLVVRPAS